MRVIAWCAAAALGCPALLLPVAGAALGATSGGTTPSPEPSGGGAVVTVPAVPYTAVADSFLVGRYRSRLHVLHNDTGFPDAGRLTLVNARGASVTTLSLPKVGTLTVQAGMVLLTPLRGATDATASFRYAAASANGPVRSQRAVVRLRAPAITVRDDVVQPAESAPTTVDIAANDVILVPGAVRPCAPDLFAAAPAPVDPRPVVLPDPARPEGSCPAPRSLTTPDGTWTMSGGALTFTPGGPFDGYAAIYYRQATDLPFDVGVAKVVVRSGGAGPGPGGPGEGGPGGGGPGGGGAGNGSGTPGAPGADGGGNSGLLGSLGDGIPGGVALPAAPAVEAPPVTPAPNAGGAPPQSARGNAVAAPEVARTVDAVSAWFMAWPVLPALVLLVVAAGRRWWRHRALTRTPGTPGARSAATRTLG